MRIFGLGLAIGLIAGSAGAQTAQPEPATDAAAGDAWQFEVVVDPITDAKRGMASVQGDGGLLVVKCDSGRRDMYVHLISKTYLGGRGGSWDSRNLTYRIDSEAPVTRRWMHNGSEAALFRADAQPLIAELSRGSSRVVIRATTFEYQSVDMIFPLEGVMAAIGQAGDACSAQVAS